MNQEGELMFGPFHIQNIQGQKRNIKIYEGINRS